MTDFNAILCGCEGQSKSFCEILNEFYHGKIIEIYCGDVSEEVTFDQVSTRRPGILVGKVIGAHGATLVVDAHKPNQDGSSKIVCIQESCIIMITERNGEPLENYFMPSQLSRKIKLSR